MDRTQSAPTPLEVLSVHANLTLPETHSRAVLTLMNAQLWKDHAETMQFVKMLHQDTTASARKAIVQNQTLKLLVNKLM